MARPAASPCPAQAFDHDLIVGDDLDFGALRQCRKTLQFLIAKDVESQQHVGDAGIGHDFRLAEFLHRDALGTQTRAAPWQAAPSCAS